MIVVKIMGGLGNQLFQYSYAKYLQKIYPKHKIYLENSSYKNDIYDWGYQLHKFSIDIPLIDNKRWKKTIGKNIFFKMYRQYRKVIYINQNNIKDIVPTIDRYIYFYDGYWHCSDIVNEMYNELKKTLHYNGTVNDKTKEILDFIQNKSNIVSVHVRQQWSQGNNRKETHIIHPQHALEFDYYKQAISFIREKFHRKEELYFLVFGDDIEWAKVNIGSIIDNKNVMYLDAFERNPMEDFLLMRKCSLHIISNSTFAWWASYMRCNKGIEVAPYRWYIDENLERQCTLNRGADAMF